MTPPMSHSQKDNDGMKRVLMIAFGYPPWSNAGSHRPGKLAKYLPEFGWQPSVICSECTPENADGCYDPVVAQQPDACETIRIPYRLTGGKNLPNAMRQLGKKCFPYLSPVGFCMRMLRAARGMVARNEFDAVWSTYTLGLDHYVANRIVRRTGLPWVADFRDLPDQRVKGRRIDRMVKAEVKYCSMAKALTATTPEHVAMLSARHEVPAHLIYNGYDPAEYDGVTAELSEKFTIRFFGTLYVHRDPRPLFEALDLLVAEGRIDLADVAVDFHGPRPDEIAAVSEGHACRSSIHCGDRVPKNEMVKLEKSSTVLLMLKSTGTRGAIPSKLYGYLAAGRPVLNIPGDDNGVDDVLRQTGAGRSISDQREIADQIEQWYRQWKDQRTVTCDSNSEAILAFSRRRHAEQLAELLTSVSGDSR
jgi:glycosyltransferase involved in cell wall biosynthesis